MSKVSLTQPASAGENSIISPFLILTATGLKKQGSASSKEDELAFWFSIAQGELWGSPVWGHPFRARLFSSGSANELVAAEMQVIRKLRADIPSIQINGVRAVFQGSDLLIFTIYYLDDDGSQTSYQGGVS